MMYLCGAPQSSGSSLVSWCFLQRGDTDGVLDARNDLLEEIPPLTAPNAWCKFTISSFRLLEVAGHLADAGWTVRPLLLTRDPRAVFNSLITKPYGRNGVTAEEPPLRLRLHRVHEDWKLARQHGWPVIRYEGFVQNAEQTLRETCDQLGLAWDPAMLTWPKSREQIAAPGHGSKTFRSSRGGSLAETLQAEFSTLDTSKIPLEDLRWMESEFADMLQDLGYPAHADASKCPPGRAVPSLALSRRSERDKKPMVRFRKAFQRTLRKLGGSQS
jgi:hypothetical protein